MKHSPLYLSILLSLGLTACGGGGGGGATGTNPPPVAQPDPINPPTPVDVCTNIDGIQEAVPGGYTASNGQCTLVDACLNYAGYQTVDELAGKGFIRDETTGHCQLERNHQALSTTGVDVVRMAGYTGRGVGVAIVDTGYLPNHSEYVQSVVSAALYVDQDGDNLVDQGEKIDGDYYADHAFHGTPVAVVSRMIG
jgi:subtilisin family serine protease